MNNGTKEVNRISPTREVVTIPAPSMATRAILIRGTAPYVQNRFGRKAMEEMRAKQEKGDDATKGKKPKRKPKDFDDCYQQAMHRCGPWIGIPASAFRAAMVSACRLINFKMTLAKLSVFIESDGLDDVDQIPLVRITKGTPKKYESFVRVANGAPDIRARPMWAPGWEAVVRIRWDADQFTTTDVTNLLMRVGCQVGLGEGRPDSKDSTGLGWGLFEIVNPGE